MRARNAWIGAGIAIAGAAVAWLFLRSTPEPPAATRPDPTPTPRRNFPSAVSKSPETPASRTPEDFGVSKSPENAAEITEWREEARDEGWAAEAEGELGARLEEIGEAVGVRVTVSCRTRRCEVRAVAGSEQALAAALARFEEPGGLYGYADGMVVGAIEPVPGGTYQLTVFAEFDREP
jgi:hypothetical protein